MGELPIRFVLLFFFFNILFSLQSVIHPAALWARSEPPAQHNAIDPSGVIIQDGSFVMNVGEVQINITNNGMIGSAPDSPMPYSDMPSCQWPAGSGDEYLFAAGLWVGGIVLGERLVSTGGMASEWKPLPEIENTIYEAMGGFVTRPMGGMHAGGRRFPESGADDDQDGWQDEETLNGYDDDGDGLIDEDFGQVGNQMFVLTNVDNTPLSREEFPDHNPMNLEMVQTTLQWENDTVDDFVGFDYRITNIGVTDIERVYVGFFADSDIGPRGVGDIFNDDQAGSYSGVVRASDGSWVPVEVGYMWDDSETIALDGYFGILFLGHDVDPSGRKAPPKVGLRTFQKFSASTAFEQGGDPTNDDESYQLLSALPEDWDTNSTRAADYRFMVSAGPFALLEPDDSLTFQVGMVVGSGLGDSESGTGLLAHCAEAALSWYGIQADTIATQPNAFSSERRVEIGVRGRETMLCREDFEVGPNGDNPFDLFFPDFGDTSCVSPEFLLGQQTVQEDDQFYYDFGPGDTRLCAMFNMDNCFECIRQLGPACTANALEDSLWTCNKYNAENTAGCTGVDGNETRISWLVGMAPPPPGLRLWAADSQVHIFWDDRSEKAKDIRMQRIDFESYRIWRADNWNRPFGSSVANGPGADLWQLIAEYDQINNQIITRTLPNGVVVQDTIPLGANTGLQVVSYVPKVLNDARFEGLFEAMQMVVDNDPQGELTVRPHLRDSRGVVKPGFYGLVAWESYPTVLDTFFMVAVRTADETNGVVEKIPTSYYEYIDREIHNGFLYFYSVTATDHDLLPDDGVNTNLPVGPGLVGDPGSSFSHTVPGTVAQTAQQRQREGANIYVFPNPATRDALEEYQQMLPTGNDPTGVRVTFTNLPAARSTIHIFTLAGDLVKSIEHDGSTGVGHTSWNLMSRNKQEITSGVYLYAVQTDGNHFDDFRGKFVVVR